jgi:hypothetical protein
MHAFAALGVRARDNRVQPTQIARMMLRTALRFLARRST